MKKVMHQRTQPISFVIRLWVEPTLEGPEWRGHVRHVQGEAREYFRDLGDLLKFLGCHAGVEAPLAVKEH